MLDISPQQPLPLIIHNRETNRLHINQSTLKHLHKIGSPIAILCAFGALKSGKTELVNKLVGVSFERDSSRSNKIESTKRIEISHTKKNTANSSSKEIVHNNYDPISSTQINQNPDNEMQSNYSCLYIWSKPILAYDGESGRIANVIVMDIVYGDNECKGITDYRKGSWQQQPTHYQQDHVPSHRTERSPPITVILPLPISSQHQPVPKHTNLRSQTISSRYWDLVAQDSHDNPSVNQEVRFNLNPDLSSSTHHRQERLRKSLSGTLPSSLNNSHIHLSSSHDPYNDSQSDGTRSLLRAIGQPSLPTILSKQPLLSIAISLTTCLLFNHIGPIDSNAVNGLMPIVEMAIELEKANQLPMCAFHWIMRTNQIGMVNQMGQTISAEQYMEKEIGIEGKILWRGSNGRGDINGRETHNSHPTTSHQSIYNQTTKLHPQTIRKSVSHNEQSVYEVTASYENNADNHYSYRSPFKSPRTPNTPKLGGYTNKGYQGGDNNFSGNLFETFNGFVGRKTNESNSNSNVNNNTFHSKNRLSIYDSPLSKTPNLISPTKSTHSLSHKQSFTDVFRKCFPIRKCHLLPPQQSADTPFFTTQLLELKKILHGLPSYQFDGYTLAKIIEAQVQMFNRMPWDLRAVAKEGQQCRVRMQWLGELGKQLKDLDTINKDQELPTRLNELKHSVSDYVRNKLSSEQQIQQFTADAQELIQEYEQENQMRLGRSHKTGISGDNSSACGSQQPKRRSINTRLSHILPQVPLLKLQQSSNEESHSNQPRPSITTGTLSPKPRKSTRPPRPSMKKPMSASKSPCLSINVLEPEKDYSSKEIIDIKSQRMVSSRLEGYQTKIVRVELQLESTTAQLEATKQQYFSLEKKNSKLQDQINTHIEKIVFLQRDREQDIARHAQQQSSLRKNIYVLESQLNKQKILHQDFIKHRQAQHSAAIAALKLTHEKLMIEASQQHKISITVLKGQHDIEMAKLKAHFQDKNRELDEDENDQEDKIIADLRAKLEAKDINITQLKDQIETIKFKLFKTENDCQAKQLRLKQQIQTYKETVETIRRQNAQALRSHSQIKDSNHKQQQQQLQRQIGLNEALQSQLTQQQLEYLTKLSQQQSNYKQQQNKLQKQTSQMKQSMTQLMQQQNQYLQTIRELEENVDGLNRQLDGFRQQVADQEGIWQKQRNSLDHLLLQARNSLSQKDLIIQTHQKSHQFELDGLRRQITQFQDTNIQLQGELQNLKSELHALQNEKSSKNIGLGPKLTDAERRIASLEKDLEEVEDDYGELRRKDEGLQSDNIKLVKEIEKLEAKVSKQLTQIASLESQRDKATTHVRKTTNSLEQLEHSNNLLQSRLKTASLSNQSLVEEVKTLKNKLVDLQAQHCEEMTKMIEDHSQALKSQINAIKDMQSSRQRAEQHRRNSSRQGSLMSVHDRVDSDAIESNNDDDERYLYANGHRRHGSHRGLNYDGTDLEFGRGQQGSSKENLSSDSPTFRKHNYGHDGNEVKYHEYTEGERISQDSGQEATQAISKRKTTELSSRNSLTSNEKESYYRKASKASSEMIRDLQNTINQLSTQKQQMVSQVNKLLQQNNQLSTLKDEFEATKKNNNALSVQLNEQNNSWQIEKQLIVAQKLSIQNKLIEQRNRLKQQVQTAHFDRQSLQSNLDQVLRQNQLTLRMYKETADKLLGLNDQNAQLRAKLHQLAGQYARLETAKDLLSRNYTEESRLNREKFRNYDRLLGEGRLSVHIQTSREDSNADNNSIR